MDWWSFKKIARIRDEPLKKTKVFKMDCQNKFYKQYKAWKTTIQNKVNKEWEKIGTIYCLGCKDETDNFKPQDIKMTSKVLREKSNCVVCRSS